MWPKKDPRIMSSDQFEISYGLYGFSKNVNMRKQNQFNTEYKEMIWESMVGPFSSLKQKYNH